MRIEFRSGFKKIHFLSTIIFIIVAAGIIYPSAAQALSVDYDGDGVADAYGSAGDVPMPSLPTPVPQPYYDNSQDVEESPPAQVYSAPQPKAPTSEEVAQNMIMTTMMEGIFSQIFAPTPTGPDPQEQLRLLEEQRKLEEKQRQEFLKKNTELKGMIKGVDGQSTGTHREFFGVKLKSPPGQDVLSQYAQPAASSLGWGTMPKILREQNSVSEQEWDLARVQQARIDKLRAKGALTDEEIAELEQLEAGRNSTWKKAVSNTDLTQEERERLKLKLYSKPAELSDHPMIDSRAFVQKEQWTDPYLDVARAATEGGASTYGISLTEDGGKNVLKAVAGKNTGFDELLALGKAGVETPKTDADKVIAVGDYALSKTPWGTAADIGANSIGAGTRQAIVRYWAEKDSSQYYDPTPVATAKEKWNVWFSDQNEWTKGALNRVGAGEFK